MTFPSHLKLFSALATMLALTFLLPMPELMAKKKKNKKPQLTKEQEDAKYKHAHTPYLSPAESLKTIELQDGYSLELVIAEPTIKEPVIAVFDGNGRMFVAEMRTYMQDADNTGKFDKTSVVSLHEDTNGDGKYDKSTIFADKLLLPRILLPLKDSIIIGETNTLDLYEYKDTNGDGVADKKTLWYEGGKRGGNLEHQPSGLIWGMDNWLYTTYNKYRLRWTKSGPLKEETANNGGQWGLTQDQHGKPWYVNAGGERGPVNFQTNITYGAFNTKNQFQGDYKAVWPIDNIPDTQGGRRRLRDDNTLNHFTATCGAEVFLGDRLPKELHGDLFFAEPVGRLIRRTKITVKEGLSYLHNPYEKEKSEFIRSTDPNFRPVNHVTAPDGTMYIVDMYRGIIQEGNWVRRGSYLRGVVKEHGLDKNFGRGRIWRLRHKDFKPGKQPRMLDEKPAQWVKHLSHPNAWWRVTAQKLLIIEGDKSVVPALKAIARSDENYLGRMHALWTLEGLNALDEETIQTALEDAHPQVRITGIRISESLYKANNTSVVAGIEKSMKDKDENVVIQSMLSMKKLGISDYQSKIAALSSHPVQGIQEFASNLTKPDNSRQPRGPKLSKAEQRLFNQGKDIYKSLCYSCHGEDGKGQKLSGPASLPGDLPSGVTMASTLAPSFSGNKRITGHYASPVNVILHGLTGPLDGKAYTGLMVPMKSYDDQWIAAITSYVRNSFGNKASFVTAEQVKQIRKQTASRTEPWTQQTLAAAVPKPISNKGWKLSASHNAGAVNNAINDTKRRYDTAKPQKAGMWFQVQLPSKTNIAGISLDAATSKRDFPRGCDVQVSDDGKTWSQPVAKVTGTGILTQIMFSPVDAKFVRITLTKNDRRNYWSIHNLKIFGK